MLSCKQVEMYEIVEGNLVEAGRRQGMLLVNQNHVLKLTTMNGCFYPTAGKLDHKWMINSQSL